MTQFCAGISNKKNRNCLLCILPITINVIFDSYEQQKCVCDMVSVPWTHFTNNLFYDETVQKSAFFTIVISHITKMKAISITYLKHDLSGVGVCQKKYLYLNLLLINTEI